MSRRRAPVPSRPVRFGFRLSFVACVLVSIALWAGNGVVTGPTHAATGTAAGTTVAVSPSGDDTAPGTAARPVRTPARARDLARAADHSAPVEVRLADGVCRQQAPLVPDARHSGVTWTAAAGAHPLVGGGVRVTGWTVAGSGRWSAPAPAGLVDTRQLYVDGVRAQRARGVVPVSPAPTATGYTAGTDLMSRWHNPASGPVTPGPV
jgi:hypothetical protein